MRFYDVIESVSCVKCLLAQFTPFSARYWHINKSFVPIWFQFRWKSLRLFEVYVLPKGTFGCHTIVWIKISNVKFAWHVLYTEMPWHNWTHLTKKTAPLSAKHCIQIAMYFRKLLTFSRVVMLHFCATITSWFVLVLFLILLFIYVCALYVMSTSIKSGNEYFVLRGGFWLQFKDAPLYFHYKYYSVC